MEVIYKAYIRVPDKPMQTHKISASSMSNAIAMASSLGECVGIVRTSVDKIIANKIQAGK